MNRLLVVLLFTTILVCVTNICAGRTVYYQGSQSYSGYRRPSITPQRISQPNRNVDISGVRLYGNRKTNDDYHRGGKRVIYRGPQSYAGYQGSRYSVNRNSPPKVTRRPVDLTGMQLYGRRKNDKTYREGLQELAGLMD